MSEPRSPSSAPTLARVVRVVPLAVALAATLCAGLKATPELWAFPGLPPGWGEWLDRHDFIKNAAGFAVLALAAHLAFPRRVGRNAAVLGALVVAIEAAQFLLPHRHSDVNDIAAGWLGIALASVLWRAGARPRRRTAR